MEAVESGEELAHIVQDLLLLGGGVQDLRSLEEEAGPHAYTVKVGCVILEP